MKKRGPMSMHDMARIMMTMPHYVPPPAQAPNPPWLDRQAPGEREPHDRARDPLSPFTPAKLVRDRGPGGARIANTDYTPDLAPVQDRPPYDTIDGELASPGRQLAVEQAELRAQMPGLSWMPWPLMTRTVVATAANVTASIRIPAEAQLMTVYRSGPGLTWIGRYQMVLPYAPGAATERYNDAIVIPERQVWYVAGIRDMWVGIEAAGAAVSLMFYVGQ